MKQLRNGDGVCFRVKKHTKKVAPSHLLSQSFSQSFRSFLPTSLTQLFFHWPETAHLGNLLRISVRPDSSTSGIFLRLHGFQGWMKNDCFLNLIIRSESNFPIPEFPPEKKNVRNYPKNAIKTFSFLELKPRFLERV